VVEPDDLLQNYYGAPDLERFIAGRQLAQIPVSQIAPNLEAEWAQDRLLPTPEELVINGQPAPRYRSLVEGLMEFGHSLLERQVQPILVYQGKSSRYPMARYLIAVGHRRWTAAVLVGKQTLDAIVIDRPSLDELIILQFRENDEREDTTDMERVWSIQRLRQCFPEAPWDDIDRRMGISKDRREQLWRLTRFSRAQQEVIARIRLQERQAKPLHEAIYNGTLTLEQIDSVLRRVEGVYEERSIADQGTGKSRRMGVEETTVARFVREAQRAAQVGKEPTPRWLVNYSGQLAQMRTASQRTKKRIGALNTYDTQRLLSDMTSLLQEMADLHRQLNGHLLELDTRASNSDEDLVPEGSPAPGSDDTAV
jgi:ParB/RepB/Spo0J family partition protein